MARSSHPPPEKRPGTPGWRSLVWWLWPCTRNVSHHQRGLRTQGCRCLLGRHSFLLGRSCSGDE